MTIVAFTYICRDEWRGGYNYLLNLFESLNFTHDSSLVLVLFVGMDIDVQAIEPFEKIKNINIVRSSLFNKGWKSRLFVRALLLGRDKNYETLLKQYDVHVLFENACFFGWRTSFSVLAWMPDFQHRHLPTMFSKSARFRREVGYRLQILAGRKILLSSFDAKKDLNTFYSLKKNDVFVAPFAISIPQTLMTGECDNIVLKYYLPEKFFFLPNQLWPHKNHSLVIQSVFELKQAGVDVCVVVSGSSQNDNFVNDLKKQVVDKKLQKNFIMLGNIPYVDLLMLMQSSVALLNPSLFEGWSTTVEEGKALGVKMILSDLMVHQEQAKSNALFFKRDSSKELANLLKDNFYTQTSSLNTAQAFEKAKQQRVNYANKMQDIFIRIDRS